MSKEAKILTALLIVFGALVVYRIAAREEPRRVKELTYKPAPTVEGMVRPEETKAPFEIEKKPYRGVIRNPFQPLFPPPPPPPPPPVALPKPPEPVPFPVITARGPTPAEIESGKYKFLGFLQKEGDRRIFLSREKEVFIVRKGDSVGIFHVGDITENSVTLIARDTSEEFKLIIEEMKPTKPIPGVRR
jgi:hypothetical protein